jgi:hypothetical protein
MDEISFIYCNFPWGENIASYYDTIDVVLAYINKYTKIDSVVCLISKDSLDLNKHDRLQLLKSIPVQHGRTRQVERYITFLQLTKLA